jgi:hypothetical protein
VHQPDRSLCSKRINNVVVHDHDLEGGHALVLATPATASGTGKAVPVKFAQAVAEHLANRMAGQEGQWSMHLIESSAEWVTPPSPELLNSSSCHVPGALLGV